MINNLFESTTIKLTLVYLGILSVICFFISYNWYTTGLSALEARREESLEIRINPRTFNLSAEERAEFAEILLENAEENYEKDKREMLSSILVTNIIIIAAGTVGSYYLARRTIEPIEEAHREQIRFTADASHELRTPLAVMRSEIEVSLRDPKLSKSDAIDLLNSNLEELIRLSALSESLLKLSRHDETVSMDMQAHPVGAIIDTAIERTKKQASQKDITLKPAVIDSTIDVDFDAFVELLIIFIDNAIKYSPDGSEVKIEAKRTKLFTTIEVTDKGVGIKKIDQARIFDRFYRADNSRSRQNVSGHGLGLSIAKNIADAHEARLSVRSAGRGKGSTFSIRLRRA